MRKQAGFTLVELVVVIAVLGILAATALPRFVNVQNNAHKAAAQGLAGSITSAANLARAAYIASGATTSPIQMDSVNVAVDTATGWPTAAGIKAALQDTAGYNDTDTPGTFVKSGSPCTVTYNPSNGSAAVSGTGCT
ncbi:MAG TPA: type II secretion system protein [Methylophilus sp.]